MKPYGKSKKPGRIGGNPLDNVVGEAAGVQGQKVQPGKGATLEGKTATVKVGQSSSFNVSSGLVNMLDVVRGIEGTLAGADKLGNQIDKSRLDEMNKKIAERQTQDDWTKPESDGYLNDEAKLGVIRDIQKEYEGGWLNDSYRAQYASSVSHNQIQTQNLGFNGDLAWAQRSRAEQIAMGVPVAEASKNTDKIYEEILKKHGKDGAKAETIRSAQLGDAALWAEAVTESSHNTVAAWQASGGLERLAAEVPASIGYETWEQSAIASMASFGGEGGAALWESYNKDTGKFEGPYADMLGQTLRRSLEPVYNQSVAMDVEEQELNRKTAVSNAPRTGAVDFVSATSAEVGNGRAGDAWARSMSLTDAGNRPLTPGQKKPMLGNFLGSLSVNAFQMDATMTTEKATEMMNAVAQSRAYETAAFVGMDYSSPEFAEYLEEQVKLGMSTFKAAQTDRANDQDKDAKEIFELQGPTIDAGAAKEAHGKDPLNSLLIGKKRSMSLGLIDANTGSRFDATNPTTTAMGMMGTRFIIAANFEKSPEDRAKAVDSWVARYQEFINNPDVGSSELVSLLTAASKDTPYIVSLSKDGGSIDFTLDPEKAGDPFAISKAKVGTIMPYLQTDEDGDWTPLGQEDLVRDTLKNLVTAEAMINGKPNPEFTQQMLQVNALATSIFPPAAGSSLAADTILTGLTSWYGHQSPAYKQSLHLGLMRALQNNDESAVAEIIDGVITNREGVVLQRSVDPVTGTYRPGFQQVTADVTKLFGAASLFSLGGKAHPDAAMSGLNPLDLSWGRDSHLSGVDDDVAMQRGGTISDRPTVQRLIDAGLQAGIIKMDGNLPTIVDPEGDQTNLARQLNRQLNSMGYQWEYQYNKDREVVGQRLVHSPQVYSGEGLKASYADTNFSGTFDEVMGGAMDLEVYNEASTFETYNPLSVYERTAPGAALNWAVDTVSGWATGKKAEPGAESRFYKEQLEAIKSYGRSNEEAQTMLGDPDFRRVLVDSSRPARNLFLGRSSSEELTGLSNQIDETITSFSRAGVVMDGEDLAAVLDISDRIRNGTLSPSDPIWQRTQEIAKKQGYNMWETNPPMHAFKVAVMETLFPDEAEPIGWLTPYDLEPTRSHRFGSGDADRRDSQRGYDNEIAFNLENLKFLNQDVKEMRIPLFAPLQVKEKSKGDPRTIKNTPGSRSRTQALLRVPEVKGENKYQQIHSPDAVGARSGGPSYRRDGGTGSTSKPTRFE